MAAIRPPQTVKSELARPVRSARHRKQSRRLVDGAFQPLIEVARLKRDDRPLALPSRLLIVNCFGPAQFFVLPLQSLNLFALGRG